MDESQDLEESLYLSSSSLKMAYTFDYEINNIKLDQRPNDPIGKIVYYDKELKGNSISKIIIAMI